MPALEIARSLFDVELADSPPEDNPLGMPLTPHTLGIILFASTLMLAGPAWAEEDDGVSGGPEGPYFGTQAIINAPVFSAGAVTNLAPSGALSGGYDTGTWRAEALLSLLFIDDTGSSVGVGGRFFYNVHASSRADFALGGGLALSVLDPDGGDTQFRFNLEIASQIRAFLASNVALTGTVGLTVGAGDGGAVFGLLGQINGALGLVYIFD